MVELSAMVAILGCSRAPAIRFAADQTRATAFERMLHCLGDLGGVTREILTDRDVAFCIGATSDGHAILAPECVDLATLCGVVPKACRPYRAKPTGKVERMDSGAQGELPALAQRVAHEVHATTLPGRSDQDLGDRLLEAEMGVGGDQPDAAQTAADQLAEKGPPELQVLGRSHIHTHHLAFVSGLYPGRD
jgi:hypothetical protein